MFSDDETIVVRVSCAGNCDNVSVAVHYISASGGAYLEKDDPRPFGNSNYRI